MDWKGDAHSPSLTTARPPEHVLHHLCLPQRASAAGTSALCPWQSRIGPCPPLLLHRAVLYLLPNAACRKHLLPLLRTPHSYPRLKLCCPLLNINYSEVRRMWSEPSLALVQLFHSLRLNASSEYGRI